MDRAVREAIEQALGERVEQVTPLGGGDINEAYGLRLETGRTVFAKANRRANAKMFPAEARGLSWLAEARALRIPKVLAVSRDSPDEPAFIVLEYLPSGRPVPGFDERLGRGLAALHQHGAETFGLDHDNFIGRLPQRNSASARWADFYRQHRLQPQLDLAVSKGLASAKMRKSFARLFARLEDGAGPDEPPARLHGDLWGGNLHVDESGAPTLIDPAVYGGHREMDLAMMRLFGGFAPRVFEAYDEAYPLAPGHQDRVALYQLYPLMVHVNHFGGSYVASVERALARYV
jgi:protein-ribulosamine 3-kinase